MKVQYQLESVIGTLYLVASENALHGIFWKKQAAVPMSREITRLLQKTVKQVTEYLAGRRKEFDLPLEVDGTEFQKKVWAELTKIPYGKTLSYQEVARKIKNEKAVRAVGTANGRNPLSIIVPCHRVIAKSGGLGGYAGGLDIKTYLLELEKKAKK